jgi:ADP-heptose:LPS heptosyltransferase
MATGSSAQERRLLLQGARSYHHRGLSFTAEQPKVIADPKDYQTLVATNLFQELPPSEMQAVVYEGVQKQKSFKNGTTYTLRAYKPVVVEPYQARFLAAQDGVRRISNAELLSVLQNKAHFKALFVRDMGAGDIIMFGSVLREFKRQYPQAHVTAATRHDYMFFLQGLADEVVDLMSPYDASQFAISANLCRKSEEQPAASTLHRADVYASHVGIQMAQYETRLDLNEELKERGHKLLRASGWDGQQPLVGIQLYGSSRQRTWFPQNSLELAQKLQAQGVAVAFLHHSREEKWKGINLTGKTDWPLTCAVIYHCNVLVGPDSSGYHVKEAVGNGHAFALFSTINPDFRVRHYQHVTALWEGSERKMVCGGPCYDAGCRPLTCLRYLTPQRVAQAVLQKVKEH